MTEVIEKPKKTVKFNIGETVVYAKHGVGVVERIDDIDFRGENYSAYSISIKASGITLSVPVDSANEMGLRPLRPKNEIKEAIKILASTEDVSVLSKTKTWKERKKILDDMFCLGDPLELAKIVKYLYAKNNVKDLPNSERKIYDFSLKFLIHEIAEVKSMTETEADNLIAECLCK